MKNLRVVMDSGITEHEKSRPNQIFFNTRHTWTRLFEFREFPYPPEPDFFRTRPITSNCSVEHYPKNTRNRSFLFRKFPFPLEPDFFHTRPITTK